MTKRRTVLVAIDDSMVGSSKWNCTIISARRVGNSWWQYYTYFIILLNHMIVLTINSSYRVYADVGQQFGDSGAEVMRSLSAYTVDGGRYCSIKTLGPWWEDTDWITVKCRSKFINQLHQPSAHHLRSE